MKYRGFKIVRAPDGDYRVLNKKGKSISYARSFQMAKDWLDIMFVFRNRDLRSM